MNTLSAMVLGSILLISGCALQPYDYTSLRASAPRSILVIPPSNDTVEVNAPYVYLSTVSRPLAEQESG